MRSSQSQARRKELRCYTGEMSEWRVVPQCLSWGAGLHLLAERPAAPCSPLLGMASTLNRSRFGKGGRASMLKGCKNARYSATNSSYDESGWSLVSVRQCHAKIIHLK